MPLLCQSARGRAAGASQDAQAENFLGGCRPQVPFFSGAGGGAGPGLLSGCCGGLLLGQRRVAEPAHALASLALKPCAQAHWFRTSIHSYCTLQSAVGFDGTVNAGYAGAPSPHLTSLAGQKRLPLPELRQVEFAARTGVY